jgi:CRISPR-associated protein Csm4
MNLFRVRIIPESPWRTPWQSDTLFGLLCWMCARTEGDDVLRREVIEPALDGRPPFVLSDAFPGDWLPVPAVVRLVDWPVGARKTVKRARWLAAEAFRGVQGGEQPALAELVAAAGVREYTQLRNNLSRASNTTAQGGGLFPTEEAVLGTDLEERPLEYLTVYVRVAEGFIEHFSQLLKESASWGFGADRSAGKGQFRLGSELEPTDHLDVPAGADGCVVLSTFQPAATDPTDGAWEAFTKYGKLGPDFGLENIFKRPMILFRPGACFRAPRPQGWLGRAVPMRELLAPDVTAHLEGRGAAVIHGAFGLCLPLVWPTGESP